MGYTNSKLVSYKKISPHKTSPRNHKIDTITIHCMAGNLSVETCGNVFQTRQASSNYGIGSDGRIALYVDEKDRSWATSSSSNDNRAVTIEVANDGGADTGWHVSGKAMKSLIELITDICKRNDIKKLKWSTNKSDRVNHKNGCNMTVHRDYAAKSCPGDYLYGKHSYIASEVNKKLKLTTTVTASSATSASEPKHTTNKESKPTVAKPTIKNGSKGTQVKYLQQDLNYLGFKGADGNKLTVDSIAGTNVVYALKQFQKKYGLEVDGVYGEKSHKKMKALLGKVV